jgi:hypothetical protein
MNQMIHLTSIRSMNAHPRIVVVVVAKFAALPLNGGVVSTCAVARVHEGQTRTPLDPRSLAGRCAPLAAGSVSRLVDLAPLGSGSTNLRRNRSVFHRQTWRSDLAPLGSGSTNLRCNGSVFHRQTWRSDAFDLAPHSIRARCAREFGDKTLAVRTARRGTADDADGFTKPYDGCSR